MSDVPPLNRRDLLGAAGALTTIGAASGAAARPAPAQETYATVAELTVALSSKTVSAVELADAAIARIEAIDPKINAVIARDFERGRAAAKEADAARARGETKPLLGIPMTVKEAINVAGLHTTWAFPPFKDFVAQEDAVAVERLKAAGAVILGKTNTPVMLADWQTDNPLFGRTNNPYDVTKTPGGSSGGGAAAVASGMVPLEMGTDMGGSIRVPAAFCGIYGLKPTFNIIPMRGVKPPPAPDGAGMPLTVLGPLARCAADLETALHVLAGTYAMEATGYRLELPKARHEALKDYRVLVLDQHPETLTDDEVKGAVHAVAERLTKRGAQVAYKSDLLPDLMKVVQTFVKIIGIAMARGNPASNVKASAFDWMDLMDEQFRIRRQWAALFRNFDIVLAPAFGTPAFTHDDKAMEHPFLVNGKPVDYQTQGAFATMAGLGNLPATVAPVGMTKGGLPIGLQIIGPYLEDRTTIGFAKLLEQEFGGFVPPKL
ncbi:MAG TPA: amidase family protein [Rhizomicrobium sp.]|nr:amidase family protein [Rhizomicrobium sp.]